MPRYLPHETERGSQNHKSFRIVTAIKEIYSFPPPSPSLYGVRSKFLLYISILPPEVRPYFFCPPFLTSHVEGIVAKGRVYVYQQRWREDNGEMIAGAVTTIEGKSRSLTPRLAPRPEHPLPLPLAHSMPRRFAPHDR